MNSETGIIFVSKNERWVVTRGQQTEKGRRYSVKDCENHAKATVYCDGQVCENSPVVPGYIMERIAADSHYADKLAAKEEALVNQYTQEILEAVFGPN